MAIGSPVDFSWLEDGGDGEVGEFTKGWYRLTIAKIVEPSISANGFLNMLAIQLKIETESGGYAGETVFHRIMWPTAEGLEDGGYSKSTRRMWVADTRSFLSVCYPKGVKNLAEVDLDGLEGCEIFAYLQPAKKEYQGQRRPEVATGRWAAALPEGCIEGPTA